MVKKVPKKTGLPTGFYKRCRRTLDELGQNAGIGGLGVVDEDIDTAVCLDRLLDHGLDVLLIGDICFDEQCPFSLRCQFLFQFAPGLFVVLSDDDAGAFPAQSCYIRLPQAGAPTSDDGDLSFKTTSRDYLEVQLKFFWRHKSYLLALVKSHKEHIVLDTINGNIDLMGFGTEETLTIKYYAGGIYNIMFSWLQSGEDNDLDILLNTTSRLMDPAIFEKAIRGYLLSFTRYQ